MRLTKHHGLGNDFAVLLDLIDATPVTADLVRAVCDRHRGLGADGFIRAIRPPFGAGQRADLVMELYNADGRRAEMSGNGISCLAQAAVEAYVVFGTRVCIATDAGLRVVAVERGAQRHLHNATVDMGTAKVGEDEPEWTSDVVLRAARVDVGNPHLVLHAVSVDDVDVEALGRSINELVPGGINVEVVQVGPGDGELTMAVYERGVGVTEACGTGACAVAAAASQWELAPPAVQVRQPGGTAGVRIDDTVELTVPVVSVASVEYHDPAVS